MTQDVGTAGSSTFVDATPNPSSYGDSVTITATVSSAGGVPSGEVTFKEGATVLAGPLTLQSDASIVAATSASVSFSTSTLPAGPHTITTDYAGDGSFDASSGAVTETVNKAETTTALLADPSVVRSTLAAFGATQLE